LVGFSFVPCAETYSS